MRDDLHKTAKCPSAWQELFRLGLNEADRLNPQRVIDAAAKALVRDLNIELSGAIKSLLRRLMTQPSLLEMSDLIRDFEPSTPLECALRNELQTCTGPQGFAAALERAITHHFEGYLREFDCRMVDGRVFERAEVEKALRNALGDATVKETCEAFLNHAKVEAKAEDLNVDEVLAPPDKEGARPMTSHVGKTASVRLDRYLSVRFSEDGGEATTVSPALAIDQERIARFCLSADTALTQDLIMLCGAIWWADRKVTRKRATAWARRLELVVPAFEQKMLNAAAPALARVLRYVTGDEWVISFEPRTDAPMKVQGLPFAGAKPAAVMPFSNGLDSFAQYLLLCADHPGGEIWRVRTTTRNQRKSEEKLLHVPLSVLGIEHPEPSYRTRAFVFFLFAALAASASGVNLVVVAENGQGSLAPALMPFANEWPFRSTHPVFVRKLEDCLATLLPAPVKFAQPQLWRTKGEVLALMAERAGAAHAAWPATQSCSNNHRHQFGAGGCGFCGGCALRRASVHAAGLDTAGDLYGFDAACSSLTLSDRRGKRDFNDNEADILRHTLRSMREFTELIRRTGALSRLQGECMDIDPDAPEAALARLVRLAEAHGREVNTYIESLPEDAVLRAMAA